MGDNQYRDLYQVACIIMVVSGVLAAYRVIILIYMIVTGIQRCRAKQRNPEYLSSDEEDDKTFL